MSQVRTAANLIEYLSTKGRLKPFNVIGTLIYTSFNAYKLLTQRGVVWLPKKLCTAVECTTKNQPFKCQIPYDVAKEKKLV